MANPLTPSASPALILSRGLGRLAYRTRPTRPLHLAVSDALAQHPALSPADIRAGWYAERQDQIGDAYDPGAIGSGL